MRLVAVPIGSSGRGARSPSPRQLSSGLLLTVLAVASFSLAEPFLYAPHHADVQPAPRISAGLPNNSTAVNESAQSGEHIIVLLPHPSPQTNPNGDTDTLNDGCVTVSLEAWQTDIMHLQQVVLGLGNNDTAGFWREYPIINASLNATYGPEGKGMILAFPAIERPVYDSNPSSNGTLPTALAGARNLNAAQLLTTEGVILAYVDVDGDGAVSNGDFIDIYRTSTGSQAQDLPAYSEIGLRGDGVGGFWTAFEFPPAGR